MASEVVRLVGTDRVLVHTLKLMSEGHISMALQFVDLVLAGEAGCQEFGGAGIEKITPNNVLSFLTGQMPPKVK